MSNKEAILEKISQLKEQAIGEGNMDSWDIFDSMRADLDACEDDHPLDYLRKKLERMKILDNKKKVSEYEACLNQLNNGHISDSVGQEFSDQEASKLFGLLAEKMASQAKLGNIRAYKEMENSLSDLSNWMMNGHQGLPPNVDSLKDWGIYDGAKASNREANSSVGEIVEEQQDALSGSAGDTKELKSVYSPQEIPFPQAEIDSTNQLEISGDEQKILDEFNQQLSEAKILFDDNRFSLAIEQFSELEKFMLAHNMNGENLSSVRSYLELSKVGQNDALSGPLEKAKLEFAKWEEAQSDYIADANGLSEGISEYKRDVENYSMFCELDANGAIQYDEHVLTLSKVLQTFQKSVERANFQIARTELYWKNVFQIDDTFQLASDMLKEIIRQRSNLESILSCAELCKNSFTNTAKLDITALDRKIAEIKGFHNTSPQETITGVLLELAEYNRNLVRSELGVASTMLTQGKYREAYIDTYKKLTSSVLTLFDEGTGKEIRTEELFKAVAEKYHADLSSLIERKIKEIQSIVHKSPTSAVQEIEALEKNFDCLSNEHKTRAMIPGGPLTFKPLIDLVQKEKVAVIKERNLYEKIASEIVAAETEENIEKRYKLIAALYEKHPMNPSLRIIWEQTKIEYGFWLGKRVPSLLVHTETLTQAYDFNTAYQLINSHIEKMDNFSNIQTQDDDFQQNKKNLLKKLSVYGAQKQNFSEFIGSIREINQKLDEYEKRQDGAEDNSLLISISTLLDGHRGGDWKNHNEFRKADARLAAYLGPVENWRNGQKYYHNGDWKAAYSAFQAIPDNEYEDLDVYRQRAMAGIRYDEGGNAENRKEWLEAYHSYLGCVEIFDGNADGDFSGIGIDQYTSPLLHNAREALSRMEKIKNNDLKAQEILDKVQGLFEDIKHRTGNQSQIMMELEPVSEFPDIKNRLLEAEKLDTNLKSQIFAQRSLLYKTWRDTYVGVCSRVLQNETWKKDEDLLCKADKLISILKDESLLQTSEDRVLGFQVTYLLLNIQFDEACDPSGKISSYYTGEVNYSELIGNRESCMDIARELERQNIQLSYTHQQVGTQYRALRIAEVKHLFAEKNNDDSRGKKYEVQQNAVEYLFNVLKQNRWMITDDLSVMSLLMMAEWENGRWTQVEEEILSLTSPDSIVRDMWLKLNQIAKAYHSGNIDYGSANIDSLRDKKFSQYTGYVDGIIRKLQENCVADLLDAAQELMKERKKFKLLSAAEKLSNAYDLDRDNKQVESELVRIREDLKIELAQNLNEIKRYKISESNIESQIKQIDDWIQLLAGIIKIAQKLELDDNTLAQIDILLEGLKEKRQQLMLFNNARDDFLDELLTTMSEPMPFQYRRTGGTVSRTGGWQLDRVDIDKLQNSTSNVQPLNSICNDLIAQKDNFAKTARELNDSFAEFLELINSEEFEKIIASGSELLDKWTKIKEAQPDWSGDTKLLKKPYFYFGERIENTIQGHINAAVEQRENCREWEKWKRKALDSYQNLTELIDELYEVSSTYLLDELKNEFSLKELHLKTNQIEDQLKNYVQIIDSQKPEKKPYSKRALDEMEQVNDRNSYRLLLAPSDNNPKSTRIQQLIEDIEVQERNLEDPLRDLKRQIRISQNTLNKNRKKRNFLDKSVPQVRLPQNLRVILDQKIQDCAAIDPNNEEVKKAQEFLKSNGGV